MINYGITLEIVENRQGHSPGQVAVYETVPGCALQMGWRILQTPLTVNFNVWWLQILAMFFGMDPMFIKKIKTLEGNYKPSFNMFIEKIGSTSPNCAQWIHVMWWPINPKSTQYECSSLGPRHLQGTQCPRCPHAGDSSGRSRSGKTMVSPRNSPAWLPVSMLV